MVAMAIASRLIDQAVWAAVLVVVDPNTDSALTDVPVEAAAVELEIMEALAGKKNAERLAAPEDAVGVLPVAVVYRRQTAAILASRPREGQQRSPLSAVILTVMMVQMVWPLRRAACLSSRVQVPKVAADFAQVGCSYEVELPVRQNLQHELLDEVVAGVSKLQLGGHMEIDSHLWTCRKSFVQS